MYNPKDKQHVEEGLLDRLPNICAVGIGGVEDLAWRSVFRWCCLVVGQGSAGTQESRDTVVMTGGGSINRTSDILLIVDF